MHGSHLYRLTLVDTDKDACPFAPPGMTPLLFSIVAAKSSVVQYLVSQVHGSCLSRKFVLQLIMQH